MADDTEAPPPRKKRGKLKLIVIGLAAAGALGGAGIAAGLYVGGGHKSNEDPNRPKLILKDGKEAPASAARDGQISAADGVLYKASYLPLDQNFTSNLRDTDGVMLVGLGVSTYYDERVLDAVKRDDMPIRSAILMTLADQDSVALATPEGKKALRKALKGAINQVCSRRRGSGGSTTCISRASSFSDRRGHLDAVA